VKRILGVALVGGILLVVVLWALRRQNAETGVAPQAASAAAASATAPPPSSATTPQGATASPVAMTASAQAPATSDATACARLAELCSTSDKKVDVAECEKDFADGRKLSGAAGVDRSAACIADAKTCLAASGCVSGGMGMSALGEFLKGLGSAISR
jgi:hypothetical protein